MKLSEITDDKAFIAFLYSLYLGRLGNDGEPDDKEFEVLSSGEDSTKYQNWHYQLHKSKERYEKDVKKYEEKIQEFFDGHADMIEFDVDQDVVKVRGRYEHSIPPKLLMEFCDKFGYYSPTLNKDWIKTSVFRHVHYRFSKKDCRIHKEV